MEQVCPVAFPYQTKNGYIKNSIWQPSLWDRWQGASRAIGCDVLSFLFFKSLSLERHVWCMNYSNVIIRSLRPQNGPCCCDGRCLSEALHKGPWQGGRSWGWSPFGRPRACNALYELILQKVYLFLTAKRQHKCCPTHSISKAMEKPNPCSSFLQRKSTLCRDGVTQWRLLNSRGCGHHKGGRGRAGTGWQRLGEPVFPTPVSGEQLPALLLQARCSNSPGGNPGPRGAREGGKKSFPLFL